MLQSRWVLAAETPLFGIFLCHMKNYDSQFAARSFKNSCLVAMFSKAILRVPTLASPLFLQPVISFENNSGAV